MSAEFLDKTSSNEWNSFVDSSPQGSVFCYYEWLEFSTDNDFQILVYRENGKIIAGMPLPFYSTNRIRLPVLTQKMGVLYEDFSDLKYTTKLDKEKKIVYDFIDVLKSHKKSYSMNFDWHFDNWLPFYWRGYEQTTRYTYVIDYNEKDLDLIWQDMDQKTRNSIRKALKHPLNVLETYDLMEFYDINKKTFSRQGMKTPYSYEYIKKLYDTFNQQIKIFKAEDNSHNVHAMNFYISDKRSVYYLMSGADADFRSSGAQDLIHWKAIEYYYDKVGYFDFEGSMIENIESNFRKFGAIQKPYFHIYNKSILRKLKDIAKIILKR